MNRSTAGQAPRRYGATLTRGDGGSISSRPSCPAGLMLFRAWTPRCNVTYLERVSLTWTIVGFGMIAVGGCGSSSSMSARTATATVPHTATATLTAQAAVTSTATPAAAHTATGAAPPTATETPPARPTETPTPAPTSAIFVYW